MHVPGAVLPDGHLPSRRWLPVAWLSIAAIVGLLLVFCPHQVTCRQALAAGSSFPVDGSPPDTGASSLKGRGTPPHLFRGAAVAPPTKPTAVGTSRGPRQARCPRRPP